MNRNTTTESLIVGSIIVVLLIYLGLFVAAWFKESPCPYESNKFNVEGGRCWVWGEHGWEPYVEENE